MKTKISLLLALASLLISAISFAQNPIVTGITMTDAGSGYYRFVPSGFSDLGNYVYTGTTWFHQFANGQATNDQAVFYGTPGNYTAIYWSTFDDPQTAQPDDYTFSDSYTFDITCTPVYEDYPTILTDTLNEEWIVTPIVTGGTAPFTYTWSSDADYTLNSDGTISIPFGENGYVNGDVVVTDANGCFTWPHFFVGQNPNAQCSLEMIPLVEGNTVQLTIHFLYGNDPVYYPDASTIDFGDGTQMYWYEDPENDGVFTHTYSEPGNYQICANMLPEDQTLCTMNDCVEVNAGIETAISETETAKTQALEIFPNPTSGQFYAITNDCDELAVYNLIGEQLANFKITNNKTLVDLPFSTGVYMVQSKFKGNIISTQKLIVR